MASKTIAMNDAQKALVLDTGEAQDIDLFRKWYKPVEDGAPIVGIILGRSSNVREAFQSDFQNNDPLYAYAIELRQPIPKASGSLVTMNEACDGMPGEVVYMFEPRVLAEVMRRAMQLQVPFVAKPVAKRSVKSARHKRVVMAWQWSAKLFPRPVTPVTPLGSVLLPTVDEPLQLPEHVVEAEG